MANPTALDAEQSLSGFLFTHELLRCSCDPSTRHGRVLIQLMGQLDTAQRIARRFIAAGLPLDDEQCTCMLQLVDRAVEVEHLLSLATQRRLVHDQDIVDGWWRLVEASADQADRLTGRIVGSAAALEGHGMPARRVRLAPAQCPPASSP